MALEMLDIKVWIDGDNVEVTGVVPFLIMLLRHQKWVISTIGKHMSFLQL
jgi:sorbitol-specific phosphotransferase system component IIC